MNEYIITYQNKRLHSPHTVCTSTLFPIKTTNYILHILYVRVHYYLSRQQTTFSTHCMYKFIITYRNNRLHFPHTVCTSTLLPIKTTDYILHIMYVRVHYYLPKQQTTFSTDCMYECIITYQNNRLHSPQTVRRSTLWLIKRQNTFSTYFMCEYSTLLPIETTDCTLHIMYVRVLYYLSKQQNKFSSYSMYEYIITVPDLSGRGQPACPNV